MKSLITYLFLIILFASSQLCFGQNKSEAVLVSSFGKAVEEVIAANLDGFFQELMRSPQEQGYVVIYPEKKSRKPTYSLERRYERFIKKMISTQGFDKNRIIFVQSKEEETIKVEFWIVPQGVDKPFSIENKWSEILPDLTKPFIFGFTDPDAIFPNFVPEFYADYLKNNENLRGHIVVFNKSREDADMWIEILTIRYKVPRNRLKVFFSKTNGSIIRLGRGSSPVEAEFWLVPKKRNKK